MNYLSYGNYAIKIDGVINILIDRRDLVKGRPKHEINSYDDAISSLVRTGFIQEYHSQGRSDICMPKHNRDKALEALKSHQNEYEFIRNLEFIR